MVSLGAHFGGISSIATSMEMPGLKFASTVIPSNHPSSLNLAISLSCSKKHESLTTMEVTETPLRDCDLGLANGSPRSYEMETSVSVLARPVVDKPEVTTMVMDCRLRWEFVNVVRLYGFDDPPSLILEWFDLPGGLIEFGLGSANGKLQGILIGGRVLPALKNGTFINTGIQSRSELIEHLSEFETSNRRKTAEMNWLNPNSPCPIAVQAYNRTIGIFVLYNLVPRLGERFSVDLCSLNSLPAVIKGGHD